MSKKTEKFMTITTKIKMEQKYTDRQLVATTKVKMADGSKMTFTRASETFSEFGTDEYNDCDLIVASNLNNLMHGITRKVYEKVAYPWKYRQGA